MIELRLILLLVKVSLVLRRDCEQTACISNCGQCKDVSLPQRLVAVYDNERVNWTIIMLLYFTVTDRGYSRYRKPISVYNQPPRSTQPSHPSVSVGITEYQPKGGDALRLESIGSYGLCVGCRWQFSVVLNELRLNNCKLETGSR